MGPEPGLLPSSPAHTTWARAQWEGSFLPTGFTSKGKPGSGLKPEPVHCSELSP